ncbi:hypothetical protein [Streptomyces sp. NBC_00691]|uniref:hypothetical protein n=1 Tax=Streptomyces sp. NBC_00691 TaxID=2903671 RepID=UPI002E377FC1|nr:hypothetical protein [Streptomyces sp. NBC_00691]
MLALILLAAAVCALVSGRGTGWTAGAVGPGLVVVGGLTGSPGARDPEGFGTVVALAVLALAWPVAWQAYQSGSRILRAKELAQDAGPAGGPGKV